MLSESCVRMINFLTVFLILGYASWQDVVSRRVSNKVWVIMFTMAFPSTFYLLAYQLKERGVYVLISYISSITLSILLGLSLFYIHVWGGADAKALIMIAIVHPPRGIGVFNVLPLVTFMNATLLSLASAVILLFYNLQLKLIKGVKLFENYEASLATKIIIIFTCMKIMWRKEHEACSKYVIVEEIKNGKKHLKIQLRGLTCFTKKARAGEYVWAMPTLPFILFIWAGLVLAYFEINLPLLMSRLIMRSFRIIG